MLQFAEYTTWEPGRKCDNSHIVSNVSYTACTTFFNWVVPTRKVWDVQFRSSEANNHIIYAEDFFDDATFEAIKVSFLLTTSWIWDASMARCDGIWISRIKLQVSETMWPWLPFLVAFHEGLAKKVFAESQGCRLPSTVHYEKEKVSFPNPKLVIDSSFTSSWNSQHLQSV